MLTTQTVKDCYEVPDFPNPQEAFRLLPKNPSESYYWERVDRNLGWITKEEQNILRSAVISIAGCGGMGGKLAEIFLRLGVGEIRIADNEIFDVSNLNRQFGAGHRTIGKSKAIETARRLRTITEDSTIVVYSAGICDKTVRAFIAGCEIICDEIEFWCVGSRILLHQVAREQRIPLFVCNTIGFGSHIFFFTPDSTTIEACLGISAEAAKEFEIKFLAKQATQAEVAHIAQSMLRGLFVEWPEYSKLDAALQNRSSQMERLLREKKGPILATNPPMAAGFLADRVLLYLLRNSKIVRDITPMPIMPGYLYFDAARMRAATVKGVWW